MKKKDFLFECRNKNIHLQSFKIAAGVAKLVDALDLGSSVYDMGVRVPPPAQKIRVSAKSESDKQEL